jgi:hypothetical protein
MAVKTCSGYPHLVLHVAALPILLASRQWRPPQRTSAPSVNCFSTQSGAGARLAQRQPIFYMNKRTQVFDQYFPIQV